ncbi:MAG: HPr family phosphocarrier protein [candidate division WOR-3 bacterium]
MPEKVIRITGTWDSRQVADFVVLARRFVSDVRVIRGSAEANAKDLIEVLALGSEKEPEATLIAMGKDEETALTTLAPCLANVAIVPDWCQRFFNLVQALELVPPEVSGRVWHRFQSGLERRREQQCIRELMQQERAAGRTRQRVEIPFRSRAVSRPLHRPSLIISHMVQRLRRRLNCTWDIARRRLAERAQMTQQEIERLEQGDWPTPAQLDKLERYLKWTLFFLFGETEQAYTDLQTAYFERLNNLSPTEADRRAFRQLYARLLRRRLEMKARGRNEPDTRTGA